MLRSKKDIATALDKIFPSSPVLSVTSPPPDFESLCKTAKVPASGYVRIFAHGNPAVEDDYQPIWEGNCREDAVDSQSQAIIQAIHEVRTQVAQEDPEAENWDGTIKVVVTINKSSAPYTDVISGSDLYKLPLLLSISLADAEDKEQQPSDPFGMYGIGDRDF